MKKLFAKHDLFKIIGITFIIALALAWIIPMGQLSGTTVETYGVGSIGVHDITVSLNYAINYVGSIALFLFALAAFYGILSKTEGYKNLVNRAIKALKGKEIVFIVVVSFITAVCASVFNVVEITLLFMPLIITIILGLKLDKLTAFTTTFASVMVGILCYSFNVNLITYFIQPIGLELTEGLAVRLGIGLLGFILLTYFNVIHAKNTLAKKNLKADTFEDPFAVEITDVKDTKKAKSPMMAMVIILVGIAIIAVLGYVSWMNIFEIKVFDEMHKAVMEFIVGTDYAIFKNIIGNSAVAFGDWDIMGMVSVLAVATVLVKFIYRIKFDDLIDNAANGIKKFLKIYGVLIGVYLIFVIPLSIQFIPTMLQWFTSLTNGFNPFLTAIGSSLVSVISPEFGFYGYSTAGFFTAMYPDVSSTILTILVAMNGLLAFVAPTSVMLVIGLKYMEIPYGTWIKYIWKFVLGLLVCLTIMFALLTYM